MQEMVEPDRTIMIVSIIALVIIWGSVAYHKFVQDGGTGAVAGPALVSEAVESDSAESAGASQMASPGTPVQKSGNKKRKKKRR